MAEIDVKRVRARYKLGFQDARKDIAELLKPTRSYFKKSSVAKTSKTGLATTYEHMTQLFADVLDDARKLNRLIEIVVELAEHCGLDEYGSDRALDRFMRFQKYLKALVTWVFHFGSLMEKPSRAYKCVVAHRAKVIELFDNAAAINSVFCTEAQVYIASELFGEKARSSDSVVVVAESEIKGTKEQVRAYLEAADPELLTEKAELNAAVRQLIVPNKPKKKGGEKKTDGGGEDASGTDEEGSGEEPDGDEGDETTPTSDNAADSDDNDDGVDESLEAVEVEGIERAGRVLRKRNFSKVDLYEYAAAAKAAAAVSDNESDEDDSGFESNEDEDAGASSADDEPDDSDDDEPADPFGDVEEEDDEEEDDEEEESDAPKKRARIAALEEKESAVAAENGDEDDLGSI